MTRLRYRIASGESRLADHNVLTPSNRSQLRTSMRRRRNAVPIAARYDAARRVARHLLKCRLISVGQRVAIYAPFDGEIDVAPFIRGTRHLQLRLYMPRIVNMRLRKMEFVELPSFVLNAGNTRGLGWLNGPTGNLHKRIDPRKLDVILLPLVAFDAHGWRLGFGAGFYDRKLAFKRRLFVDKPRLIGIGYDFQRVAPQQPSPWDVSLDAIVTERRVYRAQ